MRERKSKRKRPTEVRKYHYVGKVANAINRRTACGRELGTSTSITETKSRITCAACLAAADDGFIPGYHYEVLT